MSWHGYIVSAQSRSTYLPSYVVLGIPYESPNWEQFTFGPLRLKCYFFQFLNGSLNMKQFYILSIKPKLDMGLFVDFCVFTWIWLNLPDQNLRLFCFDVQNNFMFTSGKFSQIQVKTQKSINNSKSSFGLIGKNMKVSHVYLAVRKKIDIFFSYLQGLSCRRSCGRKRRLCHDSPPVAGKGCF